jgi:uncharacterized membrane protein YuzA (DUF378 family)
LINTRNLFVLSLVAIISVYLLVFGQNKTIELIQAEYLFLIGIAAIFLILLFFKLKLKNHEIRDFNKNNTLSLKSTILFFLIFQVVDYISEDGFIGMISMWFLYWVMGVIAVLVIETINYYKNYRLI